MRRRIIAGAGALVWLAAVGTAIAADIPMAPVVKAPVRAPSQSWYGFYIGVHGGYGWGHNAIRFTPDAFYLPAFLAAGIPATAAGDPKGFIGGVQWGSNWQFDRIVLGTDSDFSYSDIKASQTFVGMVGPVPFTATSAQRLKWFSTTRVRAGVLVTDNVLLYATGGLASGRIEASASDVVTLAGACLVAGNCLAGAVARNKWGWTVGGGIEYAEGPWQFRVEYLHYDLGTVNFAVADPLVPFAAVAASLRVSGDIVRGGISYRFNWTPWEVIFGRS